MLGALLVVCDIFTQPYAIAVCYTQVEHFTTHALVHPFKVTVDEKSLWYSDLHCTPNTTLYEEWGHPSGQCDNAIPIAKGLAGLALYWWAGGFLMWSLGAMRFKQNFICAWAFSLMLHVLSMATFVELYTGRAEWV